MGDIVKFPKFSRSSSSSAERGDAAASRDAAGKKRSKKAGKAMKSGRRSFTSGTLSMAILTGDDALARIGHAIGPGGGVA